jgi:predicted nucleotidyltransferase
MIPVVDIKNMTTEKAELTILKTLIYFDIFDYPLSEDEIKSFLVQSVNDSSFRSAIQQLVTDGIVFKIGEFYSLRDDWQKREKRLQGNRRAQKLLLKAAKIGAFLHRFPFVRAIAISGSLSKNYAEEKADIDFFVITKANRLWIARTILHLFKKFTYIIGRQHLYCMNYFIDEKALTIQEKNIYTATEIVTLFPVSGSRSIHIFFESNSWVEEWLPDYKLQKDFKISEKGSFFKKSVEWVFNNEIGDRVDNFLFTWTTRRWREKEKLGQRNSKGRVMNLITGKHFSKSNPDAFQERIIGMYANKIEGFKNQWPQYFD